MNNKIKIPNPYHDCTDKELYEMLRNKDNGSLSSEILIRLWEDKMKKDEKI